MTGGEGEEGEKVRLKNCLDWDLNPGLQRECECTDHYTKED